jgi:hypothetical protein
MRNVAEAKIDLPPLSCPSGTIVHSAFLHHCRLEAAPSSMKLPGLKAPTYKFVGEQRQAAAGGDEREHHLVGQRRD